MASTPTSGTGARSCRKLRQTNMSSRLCGSTSSVWLFDPLSLNQPPSDFPCQQECWLVAAKNKQTPEMDYQEIDNSAAVQHEMRLPVSESSCLQWWSDPGNPHSRSSLDTAHKTHSCTPPSRYCRKPAKTCRYIFHFRTDPWCSHRTTLADMTQAEVCRPAHLRPSARWRHQCVRTGHRRDGFRAESVWLRMRSLRSPTTPGQSSGDTRIAGSSRARRWRHCKWRRRCLCRAHRVNRWLATRWWRHWGLNAIVLALFNLYLGVKLS